MPRASKTGVRGLYRDDDGRYRLDLRWSDPRTGRTLRHRERLPEGTPLAAAKARARALLTAALEGTFVPGHEGGQAGERVGEAFDRYLEAMRVEGVQTKGRVAHGKVLREVLGEGRELASLVPLDLERAKKHLRGGGEPAAHAAGTINRHLTTWKHFLRWAARHGYVPRDVAARIREDVRPLREPPGRVRWIRDDEIAHFLALDGWLRPIVDCARMTAMRLSEIVTMRGAQVDRKAGRIELRRTKSNRVRYVKITPALALVLRDVPRDGYVFHVPQGEGTGKAKRTEDERRRDYTSLAFARWTARVGLEDFHFHDLRHHAATKIREAGHGLDVVASVLGHSTLAMAARYAHLGDAQRDAAFDAAAVAPSLPPEPLAQVIQLAANGADPASNEGDSGRCRPDSNRCVKVLQSEPGAGADRSENKTDPRDDGET